MLSLEQIARLGRKVRQDDWDTLGDSTQKEIRKAVDDDRLLDVIELTEYSIAEGKSLHDLMCDWVWHLLDGIADRHGEEEMYQILRRSQESWMMKRTWKVFLKLSVEERVQLCAEIMRSHRSGPEQDGTIDIIDQGDRYLIYMDPCGSGGRMRRGDPVDGTGSRLEPPYRFGCTSRAYPWSWNQENVPYYCVHCAVNELLPMEWGGHPLWVTEYDPDANKPCGWAFYKNAEDIPERYYTRLGMKKPLPGEGKY
jgi:hypothetical protein